MEPERISDDMVRELREAALGKQMGTPTLSRVANLNKQQEQEFILRLRDHYRIDAAYTQLQMERLGRIGFSLDEQVGFVSQALHSIGLVKDFSRFVLLFGHGSTSENNPYESALDCGACGGNHGQVSARVLAQIIALGRARIDQPAPRRELPATRPHPQLRHPNCPFPHPPFSQTTRIQLISPRKCREHR